MFTAFACGVLLGLGAAAPSWRTLGAGIEYAAFPLLEKPAFGDGVLHVVRVDPEQAEFQAVLASQRRVANRTAGQWADALGLVVAINAGMFQMDHRSNVGHLRSGEHLNNPEWSNTHQSVLVFGPKRADPRLRPAAVMDLDAPGSKQKLDDFGTVVQNLRLIKGEGQSVWKPSQRRWSEAAIAEDAKGRLLLLFTRSPLSMSELNRRLLALPLEIVRAMHVEGGPEASLSIRAEGFSLDLNGSYETGFNEDDGNRRQWPLPNVIGVVAREARRAR